jgi:hypothetical protein
MAAAGHAGNNSRPGLIVSQWSFTPLMATLPCSVCFRAFVPRFALRAAEAKYSAGQRHVIHRVTATLNDDALSTKSGASNVCALDPGAGEIPYQRRKAERLALRRAKFNVLGMSPVTASASSFDVTTKRDGAELVSLRQSRD